MPRPCSGYRPPPQLHIQCYWTQKPLPAYCPFTAQPGSDWSKILVRLSFHSLHIGLAILFFSLAGPCSNGFGRQGRCQRYYWVSTVSASLWTVSGQRQKLKQVHSFWSESSYKCWACQQETTFGSGNRKGNSPKEEEEKENMDLSEGVITRAACRKLPSSA